MLIRWLWIPALIRLLAFSFLVLRYPSDRDSLKVYFHAGPNVFELFRTFDHFRNDPDVRKYDAVKFLVKSMDQHHYIESSYGDKKVEWFSEHFERVESRLTEIEDSLETALKDPGTGAGPKKIRDARGISSEFLITHINQAFENWDTSRWCRHLTFEQFCEFMLPYKPWESKPELWLDYYSKIYGKINSSLPDTTPILERLYMLKDTADAWSKGRFLTLGRKMTPIEMQQVRSGDCYYDAAWMRLIGLSLGMPVSMIYTPNEANASGMHYWNAYLDENGDWREFMDRMRISIVTWSIVAPKVFLRYWGKREESFRSIAEGQGLKSRDIPDCLSPWTAVDITGSIIPCTDVEVEITLPDTSDPPFVYLAVYDDRVWDPVHWAIPEHGKALFTGMGHQALYLPVHYTSGYSSPAGDLFILDFNGEIHYPMPDTALTVNFLVDRVYPIKGYLMNNHSKDLIGSRIEGSNDSLFSQFDTLVYIVDVPKIPRESNPELKYVHTYEQW